MTTPAEPVYGAEADQLDSFADVLRAMEAAGYDDLSEATVEVRDLLRAAVFVARDALPYPLSHSSEAIFGVYDRIVERYRQVCEDSDEDACDEDSQDADACEEPED